MTHPESHGTLFFCFKVLRVELDHAVHDRPVVFPGVLVDLLF